MRGRADTTNLRQWREGREDALIAPLSPYCAAIPDFHPAIPDFYHVIPAPCPVIPAPYPVIPAKAGIQRVAAKPATRSQA